MATSKRASVVNAICLITISILNLLVHSHALCPVVCSCDEALITILCANSSLHKLPSDIPQSVQYLDLHGNQIQNLGIGLQNLTSLRTLDLSDNNLTQLTETVFTGLNKLLVLQLQDNNLNSSSWVALPAITSLSELYLGNNQLDEIQTHYMGNLVNLTVLDLHGNLIPVIPDYFPQVLPNLKTLNMSHNRLENLTTTNVSEYSQNLQILDLSANHLTYIDCDVLSYFPSIQELHLSQNHLTKVEPEWFRNTTNLHFLALSNNPVSEIQNRTFKDARKLYSLDISFMPYLSHIHHKAFTGLEMLQILSISHNPMLDYLHASIFWELYSLTTLDLSYNSLSSIYIDTFLNLTSLETISLDGNPWTCDCDLKWLFEWLLSGNPDIKKFSPSDFICTLPENIQGLKLMEIPLHNYTCSPANISNQTEPVVVKLGSSAVLDCQAEGDPTPVITWITPRKLVLSYHPAFIDMGHYYDPSHSEYHNNHDWHNSEEYYRKKHHHEEGHIHVLKNGSLFIDYVLRTDTGPYTCIAQNSHGNATAVTNLWLNYLLLDTATFSIIIGFSSAALFFLLGIIVGVIRYVAFKCSKEQRQKRKSIHQILEGLEAYKSDKFGKLSAYKTAKIDQLSAFKSAKVDKLKSYKKVTAATLVQYLHRMREHYSHQIVQVRCNCTTKAERLRDHYNTHMCKFKDYRSHQIEKIRDNYQSQVGKVREYGSSQMEKLRDQYKLQQQHILKLMEILDIGNCMTVIEAECMRTESMLFDPELNLDFDTHPVHIPYEPRLDHDPSDSEYLTAGSDNTSFKGNLEVVIFKPKCKSPRRNKQSKFPASPETSSSQPLKKHKKTQRKHKYSRKSSKHRPNQDSTSEPEDESTASKGRQGKPREQRKGARHKASKARAMSSPKQQIDTDDSSTDATKNINTVPAVPPDQLKLEGVEIHCANSMPCKETGRSHQHSCDQKGDKSPNVECHRTAVTEQSTDYDFESAQQSRDQTPEATSTPSPNTPSSFMSMSLPSSPSTPTLTQEDTHVVLQMEPDQNSLSPENISRESSV